MPSDQLHSVPSGRSSPPPARTTRERGPPVDAPSRPLLCTLLHGLFLLHLVGVLALLVLLLRLLLWLLSLHLAVHLSLALLHLHLAGPAHFLLP